jgi:hypothetical protein
MRKPGGGSDDRHSAWYWLFPGLGYARRWQGRSLPPPPDDPGASDLGKLLGDFATAFRGDMIGAGILSLRSLWCEGPRNQRAFAVPKTPSSLHRITDLKLQLENLEQTVRQWAPERCAAVASEWERLRPAGHMLALEATPVCLEGQQAEMQAEADEIFRDAYGDAGPRPRLTPIAEPIADDPDRWYVIIGSLKLAGLDGFHCSERDGLNSWFEEDSWEGTASDEAPDRKRAEVLVGIFEATAPELSTGAWFDLEGVHQAWALEREQGGEWHERFAGVARLGSHLNFLWCDGPIGIKGPYFLPKARGVVARLSDRRRSYRQAIAQKAKKESVDVRSLMLCFEVRSLRLGEQENDEPEALREWFAHATRGISLLNKLYWDAPWSVASGLALIRPPEYPPEWKADAYRPHEG